jgi:predicted ribosome quality control (RQC) complex YloA/Tae2 family protein
MKQPQNNPEANVTVDSVTYKLSDAKHLLADSAFSREEENELQRLVRKIQWNQPTYEDMKKADELTRKKWKSQGIG